MSQEKKKSHTKIYHLDLSQSTKDDWCWMTSRSRLSVHFDMFASIPVLFILCVTSRCDSMQFKLLVLVLNPFMITEDAEESNDHQSRSENRQSFRWNSLGSSCSYDCCAFMLLLWTKLDRNGGDYGSRASTWRLFRHQRRYYKPACSCLQFRVYEYEDRDGLGVCFFEIWDILEPLCDFGWQHTGKWRPRRSIMCN